MTTPVPIGKLLKEYLDDLNEERLKEFQWYLVQIQIEGSRPIPRSKLPEKATREETVDKLVEVFGEDGAVERTVDTFYRMNLNDLALKLIQAKVDQSMEQKEDEPGTSSAREEPREVNPTVPKDLFCSICLSLFTDPVVLQCGHSFCRSCVHEDWEKNIVRECSLCKQIIPEGDPPINFSLKSLCENYRGRSQDEPSGGHRNDTESLQTPPNNIREKQEALKSVKQWRHSSIERFKTQCCNTEKQIMDDIKRRRALLDEEEKTRRDALRKETRQKIRITNLIADMSEDTCSLSDAIEEIGKSGANKSFIEDCKPELERMQTTMRNLQTISQAQLIVSRHVEKFQLRDLNRMQNNRKRTSVDVDPKTASSPLSASDHQTEVMFNDPWQLFPGNPEHSISYQQNLQENLKRRRAEHDYEISLPSIDPTPPIPVLTFTPMFNFISYDCFPSLEEHSADIMHIPCVGVSDQVEDDDEDEDEQGRAETFREEDAQS